jgi:hypothetical protein
MPSKICSRIFNRSGPEQHRKFRSPHRYRHTHRLSLVAVSNYAGSKHGIETGMLADDGPFSNYTLATPKDWRSGFVVITFSNGILLQPELVTKWDENSVYWRGKIVEV